jgi:uncharacterized protein (DUF1697 family)
MSGPRPPVWVALLRGINVGAHHRVTMAELKAAVTAVGGTDVASYIQSGNLLLGHLETDRATLTVALEDALQAACGFPVPVVLRTGDELAALLARCPFSGDDWADDRRRYVSFLGRPADRERAEALLGRVAPGERLWITPTEVLAVVPAGVTKPAYADVDRALRVTATSRAWNVAQNLAGLAAGR